MDRSRSQRLILAAALAALVIFLLFLAFGLIAGSGRSSSAPGDGTIAKLTAREAFNLPA